MWARILIIAAYTGLGLAVFAFSSSAAASRAEQVRVIEPPRDGGLEAPDALFPEREPNDAGVSDDAE